MLHRAGTPEFFCLGRINAPFAEIATRRPERYVEQVFAPNIQGANWRLGRSSDEIRRVCESFLENRLDGRDDRIFLSYPLQHALVLLIEACRDNGAAAILDRFMRGPDSAS
jgi:hypothetical protein